MRQAPVYREFAPRLSLRAFVQCVWIFQSPPDPSPQPIAPDGRPELIIHLNRPYYELGRQSTQPSVLFAGQLTRPLALVAQHSISVVGLRFRPDGARGFLGCAVERATDLRLDLVDVHGADASHLRGRVMKAKSLPQAAGMAQDYVEARVAGSRIDAHVRSSVDAILSGGHPVMSIPYSQRQFQRRFRSEVGVSPRMLAAIVRFRRVFDAIEAPKHAGWLQASLHAGYFDQAQMARDFQRFLGCTASDWARQRAGLARALIEPAVP